MINKKYKQIFYSLTNNYLFHSISKNYMHDAIIFCYHRVLPDYLIDKLNYPDKSLVTSIETFERHLKFFKKNYDFISMNEISNLHKHNKRFKICITFDDGYKDNIDYVLPLISKYQIPITIYIATRFLEDKVFLWWYELWEEIKKSDKINILWRDKYYSFNTNNKNLKIKTYNILSNKFLNENLHNQKKLLEVISDSKERKNYSHLFMRKNDLKKLDENKFVEIGLHSHTHTRFSILDNDAVSKEMKISLGILEKNLGRKISHFAFPYGQAKDFNNENLLTIRSHGLKSIATTINKNISVNNFDPYSLPRYGISEEDNINSISVKIRGFQSLFKEKFNVFN